MDLTEQPVSPEAPSAFAATEVPVKEILVDKAAELDAHGAFSHSFLLF